MAESWEGTQHDSKIDNNKNISNNKNLKIIAGGLRSSILIPIRKERL